MANVMVENKQKLRTNGHERNIFQSIFVSAGVGCSQVSF